MNIDTLRSLQQRIREATGPDRELDCIIKAVMDGRTIREDDNNILARSTRPPYDECLIGRVDPGRHQRNFTEAWSNPRVPYYTSDPDGLGACVALQRAVLARYVWGKFLDGQFELAGPPGTRTIYSRILANDCLTFIHAVVSALIAEEEAKLQEKADV